MVHPTIQIFIPDTLLPLLASKSRSKVTQTQSYHVIGFTHTTQRRQTSPNPDAEKDKLPNFIQVSIVALSTASSGHEQPSGYHDDEIVGQILTGDQVLRRPPAWTFTELPSIFVTLRHVANSSLRVERVVLDGVILLPDPSSLLLFHYSPSLLNAAHYLRHLTPEESGLPPILRLAFRPLPRERRDIIPLQGEEWPSDEIAKDPFGTGQGQGQGLPIPGSEEDIKIKKEAQNGGNSDVNAKKTSTWSIQSQLNRSMGLKQVLFRVQLLSNLFRGKLSNLAASNLILLLIFDILLGLTLSHFLSTFPHLYSTLHAQIHVLLKLLLGLLTWLRGSPAGLKLNAALNSLLWRFFSYHLHLWANYIGILEPILSLILSTIIWVGPLGFTVQLSLMKDLLSMATFHVYCLYIYATRLYRVLMLAIKSLGRLFLGRKWNPLRHRVDHVHLSISEMFLGALFFTIAIFLAPTVIIYYAVFLSLRLPVLLIEWVLGYVVTVFNSLRVVTTLLILINSPRVCDQIWLEEEEKGEVNSPPQFRIRLQSTKSPFVLPPHPFALVGTLKAVFGGQVINR